MENVYSFFDVIVSKCGMYIDNSELNGYVVSYDVLRE